jgi:hypothetical protein
MDIQINIVPLRVMAQGYLVCNLITKGARVSALYISIYARVLLEEEEC